MSTLRRPKSSVTSLIPSLSSALAIGMAFAAGCTTTGDTSPNAELEPNAEVSDGLAGFNRRNIEEESGALDRTDPATGARTRIALSGRNIALTFDCMWPRLLGSRGSLAIAKTLRDKKVKTTFFIAGACVFDDSRFSLKNVFNGSVAMGDALRARSPGAANAEFRDLIKQLVDDGHEFGNHSVRHLINDQNLAVSIDWQREMELLRDGWNATMAELYGPNWATLRPNAVMRPYWRAPGGDFGGPSNHPDTLKGAARAGFPNHFLWHVDTRDSVAGAPLGVSAADWKKDGNSQAVDLNNRRLNAGQMSQAVLDLADGRPMIVLAHLANAFHWEDPSFWQARGGVAGAQDSLGTLIDKLRGKGYSVTNVSALLRSTPQTPPVGPGPGRATPVRGNTCNSVERCVWSSDCARRGGYARTFADATGQSLVCKRIGDGNCDASSSANAECAPN